MLITSDLGAYIRNVRNTTDFLYHLQNIDLIAQLIKSLTWPTP